MTLVNLTTLFTNPFNNATPVQQLGNGSNISAFRFSESEGIKDGFVSNPLYEKFGSASSIEKMAKSNPRIMQLLKEHKIPLRVNIEELENLKSGHLRDTRVLAAKICSNLK